MQGNLFRGKQGVAAILALIVAAVLILGSGAQAKHHGGASSGSGERHLQMMMQWLDLDENQQVQVEQIIRDAMAQARAIAPPDWLSVVTQEPFDEQAARDVLSEAMQMRQQRHVIMLRAQHEIYHQVLTPEQQASYREKMSQWRLGQWKMKHGQMRRPSVPRL